MIDTIAKAIDPRYHLKRNGRQWLVQESSKPVSIRSPNKWSFGFSLDNDSSPALAFFSSNAPEGLAKICDGMIAVLYKQKLYLFAIEVKSGHRDSSSKQLLNGRLFWHWLMDLCKQHGYLCSSIGVCYISLLIWRPRERAPRKGTTVHSGKNDWKRTAISGFDASFEVKNRENIALIDLINQR